MFVLALMSVSFAVHAQTNNQNSMLKNKRMMMNSVMRLETWTDIFEDSLAQAFDNNRVDNTDTEDEVLALVKGFEHATDRFAERVEDNEVIAPDVEGLLSRAGYVVSDTATVTGIVRMLVTADIGRKIGWI